MSDGIDDLMAKLDEFAVSYTLTVTPCDDGPLRTVNVTRLGWHEWDWRWDDDARRDYVLPVLRG